MTDFEGTGSYQATLDAVRGEVSTVFGPTGVDDRIMRAARAVWSSGPRTISSPQMYAERVVDALSPPPGRRQALLNGILAIPEP